MFIGNNRLRTKLTVYAKHARAWKCALLLLTAMMVGTGNS